MAKSSVKSKPVYAWGYEKPNGSLYKEFFSTANAAKDFVGYGDTYFKNFKLVKVVVQKYYPKSK